MTEALPPAAPPPPSAAPPSLIPETRAEHLLVHCDRVPEVIDNEADATGATEMVKQLRLCKQAIDAKRMEKTRALDEIKSSIMADAKLFTEPITFWEKEVNRRLTAYQLEQERKALAAEEAARKKAEEAALAEAEKLAAEAKAAEEEARERDKAGDHMEAEAARMEAESKIEESEDVLALAVDVPAPALASTGRVHAASGAGSSLIVKWVPDLDNVEFEQVPREYLMVDEAKVKAIVKLETRSVKAGQTPTFTIPGIPIIRDAKSRVS